MSQDSPYDFAALHAHPEVQKLLAQSEAIQRRQAPWSWNWTLKMLGTTLVLALCLIVFVVVLDSGRPITPTLVVVPVFAIGALTVAADLFLGPSVRKRGSLRPVVGHVLKLDPIPPESTYADLSHRRWMTFVSRDQVFEDLLTLNIELHPLHSGDSGIAWIKGDRLVRFHRVDATNPG